MRLTALILAAGKGTRMHSNLPKVMHKIGGKPMLHHVMDTANRSGATHSVVVYGHAGELVKESIFDTGVSLVEQQRQLGTGHAVLQALPSVPGESEYILVLYGDVPLIKAETLQRLIVSTEAGNQALGLITVDLANPYGYGRIIRNDAAQVTAIVEEKDATAEQKAVTEGNTGIMLLPTQYAKKWLNQLSNDNAQGEYYLTDVIAMAVEDGIEIKTVQPNDEDEVLGVNNRVQQAYLERCYQKAQAEDMMSKGATLADPGRFDLRGSLSIGKDVFIDINVLIEGEVILGDGVSIGANCILKDCTIEAETEILPNSMIDSSEIGRNCRIGPYARIRPDSVLDEHVHIGNFVEIKKSDIASGSKINHLSYVGDSSVGSRVNIGAGTITCNYDGVNKFRTEIGDDAFIGSDSQLVAPVKIGKGATIGAGSTITSDTPENQLTISRNRQKSIPGWKRPVKQS